MINSGRRPLVVVVFFTLTHRWQQCFSSLSLVLVYFLTDTPNLITRLLNNVGYRCEQLTVSGLPNGSEPHNVTQLYYSILNFTSVYRAILLTFARRRQSAVQVPLVV